ncbi:APC family permease [Mycolicibacterium brisbanense]
MTTSNHTAGDDEQLALLGYSGQFKRSMGLFATLSLGFTYLSPLVGVYSLFAFSLTLGGPPSVWWIVIVGLGQMTVALVMGEVVSQYPLAGGIYPWTRRLWGRRYAWLVSWIYLCAMIVTVTSVAEFGSAFVGPLLGIESSDLSGLIIAVGLLLLALAFNFSGTKSLARIARIGLAAELIGVIALGLYLLLFQRKHPFSILFDSMGAGGGQPYVVAFIASALTGLFLFYGFEACGDVAEEVADPGRGIPKAMILTIVIGGVSALMSYVGYVLAAPNLQEIVDGQVTDPIPTILDGALGHVGSKLFLVIAVTAFISCVLSLQAAASRLLYSFARDRMLPASSWLARMSANHVPTNALLTACLVPITLCLVVFWQPDSLPRITAFAVCGIYIAFQAVVLAALRQRLRGWRPGGLWTLGRFGMAVNIIALIYGVTAMILMVLPVPGSEGFVNRWIVAIGLVVVIGTGAGYLLVAKPDRHSLDIPEGDAVEVGDRLRALRRTSASDKV